MKKPLFTVHDVRADNYAPPFVARTDAEAARQFTMAIQDKRDDNLLNRYPEHFRLVHIGTFDDETGEVNHAQHKTIISGEQAKEAN